MGSVVHAVVNVVKSAAQITADAVESSIKAGVAVAGITVKLGGSVLQAAAPVTKLYAGTMKFALDNTLGRVLPNSIYGKISSFTNAGAAIAEGNLTTQNFRAVVKGFMDIGMITQRISNESYLVLGKTSIGKSLDHYSGGLLTSVHNLGRIPVVLETNALSGGNEKINWNQTLLDALKVGLAVASGGTAVAVMTSVNIVGEKTGLNKNSLAMGVLSASALIAVGSVNFSQAAMSGATTVGTKAVINNTALGDTGLGRAVASVGVGVAVGMIGTNNAFPILLKNNAISLIKTITKNEITKELATKNKAAVRTKKVASSKTIVKKVPVKKTITIKNADGTFRTIETGETVLGIVTNAEDLSAYETIGEIVQEAKDYYNEEIKALGNTANETSKLIVSCEADRVILKRMEEVYGHISLYGLELGTFVLAKYGPLENYSPVIVPDDYLSFQITTYKDSDRITTIDYSQGSNKLMIGAFVAAGIGAIFLASNN
jgi:hypothetical protein